MILFTVIFTVHLYTVFFEMNLKNSRFLFILMMVYVFLFHLVTILMLINIFFNKKEGLSKGQILFLKRFSVLFLLIKSLSVLYLILIIAGQVRLNLTFYLLFFLYNLFPLIYMERFIRVLYPHCFYMKERGGLVTGNLEKYRISKREQEIILLIFDGLSNKEIEKRLFISLATVKDHIYKIYKKTGVKNRVQLINLFFKQP